MATTHPRTPAESIPAVRRIRADDYIRHPEDPWSLLPVGPRSSLAMAAVEEFSQRGFHATSTRDIAKRVGMSAAGLYVHYESKADLLYTISLVGHKAAQNAVEAAMHGLTDPRKRVRAYVKAFTTWHAVNHSLARVLQYELRSLTPAHFTAIAKIRRTTERQASKELRPLVKPARDLKIKTRAILSLGIDVARWYDPAKAPLPEVLGEKYAEMIMCMLGK